MDRENRVARMKACKCSGLIDLSWSEGSDVGQDRDNEWTTKPNADGRNSNVCCELYVLSNIEFTGAMLCGGGIRARRF
jgi:hypothetical protein